MRQEFGFLGRALGFKLKGTVKKCGYIKTGRRQYDSDPKNNYFLLVRLERPARPHHKRRRAPNVLQATVVLGCKGCGLPPAVGTEINAQGAVLQQMI